MRSGSEVGHLAVPQQRGQGGRGRGRGGGGEARVLGVDGDEAGAGAGQLLRGLATVRDVVTLLRGLATDHAR